jgi:hypothetical protein
MAKKYKFKLITMFSVAVLLITGFIFYNLPNNLVKGSKGLNNKMSGLAANCYDINKPVTLNERYTKNIACKNVPPPVNNLLRVNYYNSGETPEPPTIK